MSPLCRLYRPANCLAGAFLVLLVAGCSDLTTGSPNPALAKADTPTAPPAARIELDVPYVPTPHEIVASMLEMAAVGPDDHLIDLGSGDGRIVIAAVRDRDARSAEGIDLDPVRVAEARANAIDAGVAERVRFIQGDLFDMDFSSANVLTLYLTHEINLRLRTRILDVLAPGSRVVSHVFDMDDWPPDHEAYMGLVSIYGWIVPARVAGRWSLSGDDGGELSLVLAQRFQFVDGSLTRAGQTLDIDAGRLVGRNISLHAGEHRFAGEVANGRMTLIDADGSIWRGTARVGE